MYKSKFINDDVMGYRPFPEGWLWPLHDTMFGWFQETIEHYTKAYKRYSRGFNVAVQAGGHCGVYPMCIANIFNTVYTFEPDTYSFHYLVNNCQNDNIKKFNGVLGCNNEMMYQKFRGQWNVGVNTFGESRDGGIMQVRDVDNIDIPCIANIPQFTIDQLNLTQCDLIHLDTEGSEDNIFRGAINTITKFKPLILTESIGIDMINTLRSIGYAEISTGMPIGDTLLYCENV